MHTTHNNSLYTINTYLSRVFSILFRYASCISFIVRLHPIHTPFSMVHIPIHGGSILEGIPYLFSQLSQRIALSFWGRGQSMLAQPQVLYDCQKYAQQIEESISHPLLAFQHTYPDIDSDNLLKCSWVVFVDTLFLRHLIAFIVQAERLSFMPPLFSERDRSNFTPHHNLMELSLWANHP